MRLDNHSNYAIRGTSVNGFTLNSSLVDGANGTNASHRSTTAAWCSSAITGTSSGMTGTSSITNSTIQGGFQRNIAIDNSVGTLNLTVSGNTIRRTSDAAGDDGFFLEADTTANVTLSVTNNTFARHGGDHINVTMLNNAVVNATITGNTLHGNYPGTPEGNHPIGLSQGIFLFGATFNGTFTYNVSNNGTVAVPFRGDRQVRRHRTSTSGSGTGTLAARSRTTSSVIRLSSGPVRRRLRHHRAARGVCGSYTTLITDNQVRQYVRRDHRADRRGQRGAATRHERTTPVNFDRAELGTGVLADNGFHRMATPTSVCLPHQREFGGHGRQRTGHESGRKHVPALPLRRGSIDDGQLPGTRRHDRSPPWSVSPNPGGQPRRRHQFRPGRRVCGGASCPLP